MSTTERLTQQGMDHLSELQTFQSRLYTICNALTGSELTGSANATGPDDRQGVYGFFNVVQRLQEDYAKTGKEINNYLSVLEEHLGLSEPPKKSPEWTPAAERDMDAALSHSLMANITNKATHYANR